MEQGETWSKRPQNCLGDGEIPGKNREEGEIYKKTRDERKIRCKITRRRDI